MNVENASVARAIFAAFCATFVGIGLARFAYGPLLPALVNAGWFDASDAAFLGAANFAGYLAGASFGRSLTARLATVGVLRAMMVLATLSFFCCSVRSPFLWFAGWRFLAGLSGGVLMVLAATAVLPAVDKNRRGLASGIIFTGIGLGVIASGSLVPLLLKKGLLAAWSGVGSISALLTVMAWFCWPSTNEANTAQTPEKSSILGLQMRLLYLEYALIAFALVPHMVFLVDFVARGLDQGVRAGANYWILFGLGATAGPVISGYLADRIGFARALRQLLIFGIIAAALPSYFTAAVPIALTSIFIGAAVPGSVMLVLGRTRELVRPESGGAAWSLATVAFSIGQAVAAYIYSSIFVWTGQSYRILFAAAAASFLTALAVDLSSGWQRQTREVAGASE